MLRLKNKIKTCSTDDSNEMTDSRFVLDVQNYDERIIEAGRWDSMRRTSESEIEKLHIFDGDGQRLESPVSTDAAHRFGLIHKTADLLLSLPDQRIVIQQRSFNNRVLPGAYGLLLDIIVRRSIRIPQGLEDSSGCTIFAHFDSNIAANVIGPYSTGATQIRCSLASAINLGT